MYGTVQASTDRSAYRKDMNHWLVFENIHDLTFQGGGIINGNGKTWWKNSCKVNKKLVILPLIITHASLIFFSFRVNYL